MSKQHFFLGAVILALFVLSGAGSASAIIGPGGPIVPCGVGGTGECTLSCVPNLIKNVIDYLMLYVAIPLGTIMVLMVGLMFILSAGNQGRVTDAKKRMYTLVQGIAIVFIAWIAIDVVIRLLAGGQSFTGALTGAWNELPACETADLLVPPPQTKYSCNVNICVVDPNGPYTSSNCGGACGEPPPPKMTIWTCGGGLCFCSEKQPGFQGCTNLGTSCVTPGQLPCPNPSRYFCFASSVSPETQALVTCVKAQAAAQGLPITGVTTNLGTHTCELTKNPPNISCHYGGTGCNTTAHAADFNIAVAQRNPLNWNTLNSIALGCGARGSFCENSTTRFGSCDDISINHIHANDSVASCNCN